MKFQMIFKTPDPEIEYPVDPTAKEVKAAVKLVKKYVEYGEYVTIEFDTETGEAYIIKLN